MSRRTTVGLGMECHLFARAELECRTEMLGCTGCWCFPTRNRLCRRTSRESSSCEVSGSLLDCGTRTRNDALEKGRSERFVHGIPKRSRTPGRRYSIYEDGRRDVWMVSRPVVFGKSRGRERRTVRLRGSLGGCRTRSELSRDRRRTDQRRCKARSRPWRCYKTDKSLETVRSRRSIVGRNLRCCLTTGVRLSGEENARRRRR